MNVRSILIAAVIGLSTNAFAAEPAKPAPQPAAQPHSAPANVVLASADTMQTPAPAEQQAATPKRRIARVTTCRCGDSVPQPDDSQQ